MAKPGRRRIEPDGMYFLESGTAVVLDREGEQINVLREGQYFGEYGGKDIRALS